MFFLPSCGFLKCYVGPGQKYWFPHKSPYPKAALVPCALLTATRELSCTVPDSASHLCRNTYLNQYCVPSCFSTLRVLLESGLRPVWNSCSTRGTLCAPYQTPEQFLGRCVLRACLTSSREACCASSLRDVATALSPSSPL